MNNTSAWVAADIWLMLISQKHMEDKERIKRQGVDAEMCRSYRSTTAGTGMTHPFISLFVFSLK